MYYLIFNIMFSLLISLILMLMVAYFTHLESKLMSTMQSSNGPDLVGFYGLLQPIADALKLMFKEFIFVKNANSILFMMSPFFMLFLSLLCWSFLPLSNTGSFFNSNLSLIWIMAMTSLDVYLIFISGFSSFNKYALLGSSRSLVQFVSYEVAFSLLMSPMIFLSGSFSLIEIVFHQIFVGMSNFVYFMPNSILIFICLLAETNSAPFDLPEAEAELVAGYNVEYSSLPFAFFFLGEYLNMITMSVLVSLLLFSGWSFNYADNFLLITLMFYIKMFIFMFFMVWVSASLPRVSYDSLMNFCWKYCLPFSMSFLFFYVSFYSLLMYIYVY